MRIKTGFRSVIAGSVALLCGLVATTAHADLIQFDDNYIGLVSPGTPANIEEEANYINSLLNIGPGVFDEQCDFTTATNSCDTIGGIDTTGFDDAVAAMADKTDGCGEGTDCASVDVTGWTYLIAKYDAHNAGSMVWYLGDLTGVQNIQQTLDRYGISHFTLFNPFDTPPDEVSEPATLGLLGLGLLGAGFARRRRMSS